ncbi:MAG TPA: hypothetical protein VK137_06205, partial [Planctomycetaceae bacterium]|nr:hypothetical protein [Planctomycetaceae bacterium]
MARWLIMAVVLVGGWAFAPQSDANAQGLIWKLPEDGAWVRYEGTYKQIETRASTGQADLEIEWIQHLTIKSVGQVEAEFEGQTVPCRWL